MSKQEGKKSLSISPLKKKYFRLESSKENYNENLRMRLQSIAFTFIIMIYLFYFILLYFFPQLFLIRFNINQMKVKKVNIPVMLGAKHVIIKNLKPFQSTLT